MVIAEHLKPLREFFLILFFFAIGSKIDFRFDPSLLVLAIVLGGALVPLKTVVFRVAFRKTGENPSLSKELAVRLGQASEFSLLVAYSGLAAGLLTDAGAMVIQIATITSIVISTYWVVLRYPTPISRGRIPAVS